MVENTLCQFVGGRLLLVFVLDWLSFCTGRKGLVMYYLIGTQERCADEQHWIAMSPCLVRLLRVVGSWHMWLVGLVLVTVARVGFVNPQPVESGSSDIFLGGDCHQWCSVNGACYNT